MATKLREYFPMIREREEVLAEIAKDSILQAKFDGWEPEQQEGFHEYPGVYYHFFEQKSDTGLQIELLQKYLFIPLDIFRESKQNRDIDSERDAWLTLFSNDEPEIIIGLIEAYPEFREIYKEGYEICLNVERVMEVFSKELYELDRNTVQYMIDEMQDTINVQKNEIEVQKNEIDKQKAAIDKQHQMLEEMRKEQEKLYQQGISSAVNILRSLNMPEQEINLRICEQYQLNEEQVRKYL